MRVGGSINGKFLEVRYKVFLDWDNLVGILEDVLGCIATEKR